MYGKTYTKQAEYRGNVIGHKSNLYIGTRNGGVNYDALNTYQRNKYFDLYKKSINKIYHHKW